MARHLGPGPVTVTGNSMGGHTAARLLEHLPVNRLILFCPAAYSRAAESMVFSQGFTEELRRPGSWEDSAVWDILEGYTGKAMFIIGEHDDVIPEGVVARYLSSLRNCSVLEYLKIPGAPHLIHPWLEQNAGPREALFERLRRFMAG
ncbi:MAG: hypothetical protein M3O22_00065 [Pseudomonadota bacterium]|nr:hypothetical protein [Pseudomonadota bacterium]